MATKKNLIGSFKSLQATLAAGYSPFLSPEVRARWEGVGLHAKRVANRASEWMALPEDSHSYGAPIMAMDAAASTLAAADEDHEQLAGLEATDSALDGVEGLLRG